MHTVPIEQVNRNRMEHTGLIKAFMLMKVLFYLVERLRAKSATRGLKFV